MNLPENPSTIPFELIKQRIFVQLANTISSEKITKMFGVLKRFLLTNENQEWRDFNFRDFYAEINNIREMYITLDEANDFFDALVIHNITISKSVEGLPREFGDKVTLNSEYAHEIENL